MIASSGKILETQKSLNEKLLKDHFKFPIHKTGSIWRKKRDKNQSTVKQNQVHQLKVLILVVNKHF